MLILASLGGTLKYNIASDLEANKKTTKTNSLWVVDKPEKQKTKYNFYSFSLEIQSPFFSDVKGKGPAILYYYFRLMLNAMEENLTFYEMPGETM